MLNNLDHNEICENITELYEYKVFYKEKIQMDEEIIEKINTLINGSQRNNEALSNTLIKLQDNLNSCKENSSRIDKNTDLLDDIKKQLEEQNDDLKTNIDKYNIQYIIIKTNYKKHILNNENIMLDYIKAQENETEENRAEDNTEIHIQDFGEEQDNNVLLISEIQNEVILPYKIEELNKILENSDNEYKSIQEIIDKKYKIPLINYKCSMISRFREAFNLMKEKENSSFMDAIDLAFELMGNRYLHPAIITACENLDQLDVYLDCLNTNELEDFPFFKIKYELYPVKLNIKEFGF